MSFARPGRRTFLLGMPAAALGACSVEMPKYQDALQGLHSAAAAAAPVDAPFKAGPTVALVFGSNIERVMDLKGCW